MSTKLYPLEIVTISACLLFHVLFLSPNIVGFDINGEYFVFRLVSASGFWNPDIRDPFNSVLSVTILPAMLAAVMNMDSILIFKIAYPVVFSFVPLTLYAILRGRIGERAAFLSSFLFVSYSSYYLEIVGIAKQQVGELLFGLLFLLQLKEQTHTAEKTILMILLTLGLIYSHYSLSYVYLSYLLLSQLVCRIFGGKPRNVSMHYVALAFVMGLVWYIHAGGGRAFEDFVGFGAYVYRALFSEFFVLESRPALVLKAIGIGTGSDAVRIINIIVHYLIQFFTVVGVVRLWKEVRLKIVTRELFSYVLTSSAFLGLSVVLPYFSTGLNLTRVYQVALFFLSFTCIVGGITTFRTIYEKLSVFRFRLSPILVRNRYTRLIRETSLLSVAFIVILFFLFNVGFVQELSGSTPVSVALGFNRMRTGEESLKVFSYWFYIPQSDIESAKWISLNRAGSLRVCADVHAINNVLTSYGAFNRLDTFILNRDFEAYSARDCYIYLRYLNVVEGLAAGPKMNEVWHVTEVSQVFNVTNRVYCSGASEIWVSPYEL